jgi:hypothetical protein
MSTPEELTAQITELGEKIKQAKADKQPKELWDEHLQAMLQAKVRVPSGYTKCVESKRIESNRIESNRS